jgi:hypothetical protein
VKSAWEFDASARTASTCPCSEMTSVNVTEILSRAAIAACLAAVTDKTSSIRSSSVKTGESCSTGMATASMSCASFSAISRGRIGELRSVTDSVRRTRSAASSARIAIISSAYFRSSSLSTSSAIRRHSRCATDARCSGVSPFIRRWISCSVSCGRMACTLIGTETPH